MAQSIPGVDKCGCVNLIAQFGKRYRVTFEVAGVTKRQWPREDWPWLMEIRGRFGVVYPQGGDVLAACSHKVYYGRKLRALACALSARGDEETVITFNAADARAVFGVIKPFRRRRISEATKIAATERLRRFRERRGLLAGRGVLDARIDERTMGKG